jgi:class 3 adenylate cyclase
LIAEELENLEGAYGYASAACGGDLLFHEAMLRRGGEIHVVLPCPKDEFRSACVDIIPDSDWGERFEKVMQRATSIDILSDQCASDNAMASECCNRVVLGLGAMKAKSTHTALSILALWDGRPGDAIGGTHSMVEFCRAHNRPVRIIDLLEATKTSLPQELRPIPHEVSSTTRLPGASADPAQKICAMVFADAANFSKLTERQLPGFAKHYLGGVKRLIEQAENSPLVRNTWGDGLYVVFATVREAGLFALELRDFVCSRKWESYGLPANFNARIGLHAGPVYEIYDPIIGQWSYIGSHVTWAARIEPRTPLGEIYASRTFAALTAAEDIREYTCEYVGVLELAKGYGELPVYRVVRIHD